MNSTRLFWQLIVKPHQRTSGGHGIFITTVSKPIASPQKVYDERSVSQCSLPWLPLTGYYEVLPETFTGYAMRNRNLPFKRSLSLVCVCVFVWIFFCSSAQHFRVGNDFCHSFQFDPLILTHDQAYTDVLPRDDKDLFYYCKGTGGVRNCTTNVTRDLGGEVESFFASIQ